MIDFLVIGGGVAGLTAAAHLSELGTVVVLEAEDALGYHASGRSAALYEPTYGKPSTLALTAASRHWHMEINGSKNTPRGLMILGSPGVEDAFAHDMKTMQMERLSIAQALEIVPILDTGFVTDVGYHAEAWDIDTDACLQRFARQTRGNSGEIITNAKVTGISRDTVWHVLAGDEYQARHLVNAAGAWADELAKLAGVAPLGLQPMRRSMARVEAPTGIDVTHWPMLFGPGETWYAKPDAGALLISPAEEEPVPPQDAWAEDMTLAEGIARYQPHVTADVTRMISNWAGLRTFAPDRQLILGPDPERPDFIWCAAQGGYGFQTAPAAGQFVADRIAGRETGFDQEIVQALSPERFAHM